MYAKFNYNSLMVFATTKLFNNQHRLLLSSSASGKMLLKNKAFINGDWLDAEDGKTFDVLNPANGSVISNVPDMNVKDAEKAIIVAKDAFTKFRMTTAKQRSDLLRRWHVLLEKNKDELSRIVTLESGKPYIEAQSEMNYGESISIYFPVI